MSNDENANASGKVENEADKVSSNTKGNIISKIMETKEANPKVFYGVIAALAIIILGLMMSGGSAKKHLPKPKTVNLTVGQNYELRGVNTYDPMSTVRLVQVPGSMAAYDDTEEADRNEECKHMPQGTKVKLVQIQQAIGKASYIQVEMVEGKCAGKKGWTVSNNLN